MIIYILRHGIAEERRSGLADEERALTPEGRKKLSPVLKRALAAGVTPTQIVTSPLKRALQTAEIASKVFGAELVTMDQLKPSTLPAETWTALLRIAKNEEVIVVGHEPHLSRFAAFLLGTPGLRLELKKAALLRIRVDRIASPRGVLEWMLTPKVSK